jgi:hypothetical protein
MIESGSQSCVEIWYYRFHFQGLALKMAGHPPFTSQTSLCPVPYARV